MSKAVAFLAGLGTGYFDSQRKKKEDEAKAGREKRETDLHDARMAEVNQARTDREDLRAAAAPVAATPMQGAPTEEAMAAQDPLAATQEPIGYTAGARGFASRGVAEADAAAQSTPEGRRSRIAALAAGGNTLASGSLRDEAQLRAADLQAEVARAGLDESKEVRAQKAFSRGVVDAIGKGGWAGFAQFATDQYNDDNTYSAIEDGKGGAVVVSTGKDGKELGRKTFASPDEAIMFSVGRADPTKWIEYRTGREDKKAAQANTDRDFGLRKDAQVSTDKYRDAQLSMDRARLSMTKAAHDAENKLPPAVKAQYATYDKELTLLATTIAKAQADGNWDPKSPGAQSLMEQQRVALKKSNDLLTPYLPNSGGSSGSDDRFNLFGKQPAAGAPPETTPPAQRPAPAPPRSPAAKASQGVSAPVPYDPANPLSVVQRRNAQIEQEALARDAAQAAQQPSVEQVRAAAADEAARREAWLRGQ